MTGRDLVDAKREEILTLARLHGATHVRVFGSVARGEDDEESDIDFLVRLEPGRSLLDLGALLMDLQDLLERDVDVVTEAGLRERIRDRVLSEAQPL
ncbi:MAG: nucleotidyltransferase family protein [Anaerolineae bacterium]|nr:nucleotidyltransferase family protein [Anaerolineae bacterium]